MVQNVYAVPLFQLISIYMEQAFHYLDLGIDKKQNKKTKKNSTIGQLWLLTKYIQLKSIVTPIT